VAGEKILVVDDRDDSLIFLTEYILQPNGYRFITAKDGITGLDLALKEKPDLIIMDLKMPKMTGLEVLAALRERDANIPVILMTFHG
jgi:CheY-like chemotaxis protein